jgi:quercetin 2,3-dioxygenase
LINPLEKGQKPGYEQLSFSSPPQNELTPVASGLGHKGAVSLHADAAIFKGALDAERSLEYTVKRDRRIFVYLSAGEMAVGEARLQTGDQARVSDEQRLTFSAATPADFILIDVPATP